MSLGPGFQLAFKHKKYYHSNLGLKIKLSQCRIGPDKSGRFRTLYQTAYLLLDHKLALCMANGLLTELGLSMPPKFFFENFIDECISVSVDVAIY